LIGLCVNWCNRSSIRYSVPMRIYQRYKQGFNYTKTTFSKCILYIHVFYFYFSKTVWLSFEKSFHLSNCFWKGVLEKHVREKRHINISFYNNTKFTTIATFSMYVNFLISTCQRSLLLIDTRDVTAVVYFHVNVLITTCRQNIISIHGYTRVFIFSININFKIVVPELFSTPVRTEVEIYGNGMNSYNCMDQIKILLTASRDKKKISNSRRNTCSMLSKMWGVKIRVQSTLTCYWGQCLLAFLYDIKGQSLINVYITLGFTKRFATEIVLSHKDRR
jgi:hypothetical protein